MDVIRVFLTVAILVIFVQCNKEDDAVTVHCENLVNEVLPSGDNGRIDVANAFTPNGDGLNDVFRPLTNDLQWFTVKIYDIKSRIVFDSSVPGSNWVPNLGNSPYQKYFYRVEGITAGGKKIGKCGEVYALSCYPQGRNPSEFSFEDQYTGSGFTAVTNEILMTCN